MHISRKIDYGLVFLVSLKHTYRSEAFRSLEAVAEAEHLPLSFLEKLAAPLRRAGIIESKRGITGGYRLCRDPESLTLAEIIRVFEEPPLMRCLRSPHPEKYCPLVATCPTRKTWRAIEKDIQHVFERVTVATL